MATNQTEPEVFIVESLKWEDEENNRFEGKILTEILTLARIHRRTRMGGVRTGEGG